MVQKKSRAYIFVSGRVQGVFFRDSTRRKAKTLDLTGWVRNLPDGRVQILAEGRKSDIEKLISWAQKGSLLAKVRKVDVKWQDSRAEFTDFEIRY